LSFGEEAEEDEEETNEISKKSKIKSSHDILDDPKLSSEAVTIEADDRVTSPEPGSPEKPEPEAEEEEYYLGKGREEELLQRK